MTRKRAQQVLTEHLANGQRSLDSQERDTRKADGALRQSMDRNFRAVRLNVSEIVSKDQGHGGRKQHKCKTL